MKRIKDDYLNIFNQTPCTLTFGNFDGIHLGHQSLIDKTTSYEDTKSVVMTFDPHPNTFLRKTPHRHLMTMLDKFDAIAQLGIDELWCITFNEAFSKLSYIEFIEWLKSLHVKRIVIGQDARFGKYGEGRVDHLKPYFDVVVMPDTLYDGTRVSSTYVKDVLTSGDIGKAKKLLSRHYRIHGAVTHGNHLGRTLGFPTANIHYDDYVIPKMGVYYVKLQLLGNWYYGMANIGHNPTINYQTEPRLEIYIFDFTGDIYGKHVTVDFYHYIRAEQKFSSKEALIEQLKNDEMTIRKLIKS
jgi:riboflavin kinase / FMN adenylyltransferase